MKHLWRHNHVHPEEVVVLRKRDAIFDEALELVEVLVLEEEVSCVVRQLLAASFSDA